MPKPAITSDIPMKITLASHYGMCFGVRDAVKITQELASQAHASGDAITILGDLVHNPVVEQNLSSLGTIKGNLNDTQSASTQKVVITAHGAANKNRRAWQHAGYHLTDTTCPLVNKAHNALARLVAAGFHPVIIGKAGHVEVQGLAGDFPQASIILTKTDIQTLPFHKKIGVVSQTTQPIDLVKSLIRHIETHHPTAETRFIDTVCQPTKDRQSALEKLAREHHLIIVVGGHHSNNTTQLVQKARALGATAHHVATPEELDPAWFLHARSVGITAGTSTLEATVQKVLTRIREIAALQTIEPKSR
ncbi:MAG: 4-hydroxy-3-methylbut-2-enyl diphosphate reductase [Verrucomicrobiota bacterium]